MPHQHLTSALTATLAALVCALGLSPAAGARAAKPAAPPLSIESKTCNIGPDPSDRSAQVTAKASYDDVGAKVQLRFSVQQRASKTARWRSVLSTDDQLLGQWTETDGTQVDLRYTKIITGLSEGVLYRVAVDARSVTDAGVAASKQVRKYVPCTQPLFTPTLQLTFATDAVDASGAHTVSVLVKNLGRLAATDATVTIADDTTRAVLGTAPVPALKGSGSLKLKVPIASCDGNLFVSVQPDDAKPADIQPGQSQIVGCDGAPPAKLQSAGRR